MGTIADVTHTRPVFGGQRKERERMDFVNQLIKEKDSKMTSALCLVIANRISRIYQTKDLDQRKFSTLMSALVLNWSWNDKAGIIRIIDDMRAITIKQLEERSLYVWEEEREHEKMGF